MAVRPNQRREAAIKGSGQRGFSDGFGTGGEPFPGRDGVLWSQYLRRTIFSGIAVDTRTKLNRMAYRLARQRPPSHYIYMVWGLVNIDVQNFVFQFELVDLVKIYLAFQYDYYNARPLILRMASNKELDSVEARLYKIKSDLIPRVMNIISDAALSFGNSNISALKTIANGAELICWVEDWCGLETSSFDSHVDWPNRDSDMGDGRSDPVDEAVAANDVEDFSSLPSLAPELYRTRKNKNENAITFFNRYWSGYVASRILYLDDLRRLDPSLVAALESYCQRTKTPRSEVLPPPRSKRTDAVVARAQRGTPEYRSAKLTVTKRKNLARRRARARAAADPKNG